MIDSANAAAPTSQTSKQFSWLGYIAMLVLIVVLTFAYRYFLGDPFDYFARERYELSVDSSTENAYVIDKFTGRVWSEKRDGWRFFMAKPRSTSEIGKEREHQFELEMIDKESKMKIKQLQGVP